MLKAATSSKTPTTKRKQRYFSNSEKREIVAMFERSSLKLSQFCQKQGISKSALYRWQKELSAEGVQQVKTNTSSTSFVPIQMTIPKASEPKMVLNIAKHISIEMPSNTPAAYIANLVKEIIPC